MAAVQRSFLAVVLLLSGALWHPAAAQMCLPGHEVVTDVGLSPRYSAAADVDGDQDLDLVVSDVSGSSVHVLRNDGTGQLHEDPTAWFTGGEPEDLVLADFDLDGDPDIVISLVLDDALGFMRNNGNGAFAVSVQYPTGHFPFGNAAGHLDGDSFLDLVVACGDNPGSVSVLRGQGDGSFLPATTFPSGGNRAVDCALADLDGDTDLDLIVVNEDSDNLGLFLNDGNAVFSGPTTRAVADEPGHVEVSDLDQNGAVDLLVSCGEFFAVSGSLDVLYHQGGLVFVTQSLATPGQVITSSAQELDGDGFEDVLVAFRGSSGNRFVEFLHNDGAGQLVSAGQVSVPDAPYWISAADFDADQDLDPVIVCDGPGSVLFLDNDGSGTFGDLERVGGLFAARSVFADLDRDGLVDVVAPEPVCCQPNTRGVYVQLNQGGSLGPAAFHDTLRSAHLIVPEDLDLDGDLDLVVQCDGFFGAAIVESGISVLENLGDGTFAPPSNHLTGFNYWMQSVTVADFSGDGLPDLVVGGFQNARARTNYLLNRGNLVFDPPLAILQRNSEYLASRDLDLDGRPELLVQKPFPDQDLVEIYSVSGGTTFVLQETLDGQGHDLRDLALDDFSGDGLPDVAYLGVFSSRSQILLFEGLGALQFAAGTPLPTDGFASTIRLLHLTDDCDPEILTTNSFTASVSAYENLGGTFAAPLHLLASHNPFGASVIDFDGDLVPELVVALDDNDLDPTTNEIGLFRFCGGIEPPVAPFVASVAPGRGKYDAATAVSILGSGFAPAGTVRVFFGSQEAASVTVVDPQTLTAVTPAAATGPVSVRVQNCAGEDSLAQGFVYTPALLLSGDFSLGGTFTRTYLNEVGDSFFAILGFPPQVAIPTPPYDGTLCILPFFREFLLLGNPQDHLTQVLVIPNDPILAGVQILFQALIGSDFQGADREGSWTNCAVLSIEP